MERNDQEDQKDQREPEFTGLNNLDFAGYFRKAVFVMKIKVSTEMVGVKGRSGPFFGVVVVGG